MLATCERGHYEPGLFDVRSPSPRPTALARVAEDCAAGRQPDHPVLRGDGWWRRSDRFSFGPAARAVGALRTFNGAPILIVGRRGTLGRAFVRVCSERGLHVHVVGRAEMDISDPAGIDAVLRGVKPWAVINAAGYVRVDAAEGDLAGCWRDNVLGVVNLAAACRRRDLRLVTFSSDLVFDGSAGRPYLEGDAPAPLNVYGAAKAEAERRVLDLLPEALVIRTSAFFGPWDDFNFAAGVVRAAAERQPFRAPDDYVVSPTYVPELAHATLDLLADGERGVWHLANQGAVTWYEFARVIAAAAGLPDCLIEPCRSRDVWQPARRPPYSVLGSGRGALLRPLGEAVTCFAADLSAEEASRCASS